MNQNRKTTLIGLLLLAATAALQAITPYLPDLLAPLQNNPKWSWIPVVVGIALTAIGPSLRRQNTEGEEETAQPFFDNGRNRHLRSVAALLVCGSLVLGMTACGKNRTAEQLARQRAQLETIQRTGQQVAAVFQANETLPDQLFEAKVINEEQHTRMKAIFNDIRPLIDTFNNGLRDVLASEDLNAVRLVPTVSQLIVQVRSLKSFNLEEKYGRVLAGMEIGLRAIATYFALARMEAHAEGYTDQQMARAAGLKYDREVIETIVSYANRPATEPFGE
jgi:hypothetical protein